MVGATPRRAAIPKRVRADGLSVAGVPLHVTPTFAAVAVVLGFLAARDVARASLIGLPHFRSLDEALHAFDAGRPKLTFGTPSIGWAAAAGLGVTAVYAVSVLAHELAHLTAARLVGVDVAAIRLHAVGGSVEMDDEDALTAGRLALIVGAGPLVTGALALLSGAILTLIGWPLTDVAAVETGGAVALGRVLSYAFVLNLVGLVINLMPIRALDGGQLLVAARLRRVR